LQVLFALDGNAIMVEQSVATFTLYYVF